MMFEKKKRNIFKPVSEQPDNFIDGFGEWLDTKDGEDAMQAIDDINEFLRDALVDTNERKIILSDDVKLTITQIAEKIKQHSEAPLEVIIRHIILWLQMEYVPDNLSEKEMENFEIQIEEWIENYKNDA
ncbi:hypothetical protein QUF61_13325 [Candidatus Venteria ishoeyi]|uniref:hypothetical protein n=1 Tax=Candidatus Venteria ishoeyi TaxID=1899563 RepID=UPI0025A66BEA|nr:hypothetical protein [Candidatus Venteria ishoeyi]MDM8547471.1 hypothetical protein [Candidatus Venteria ishoeyi]